jgi:hypothetical protein
LRHMRYFLLIISLLVIGAVVWLEVSNMRNVLHLTSSADNPNSINLQLQDNQAKVDKYNNDIEATQNQTDNAVK